MSWEERIRDLANVKRQELNIIEEEEKRRREIKRKVISEFGPVVERITSMFGGYISKRSDDWWSLRLKKASGEGTNDSVEVFLNFPEYLDGLIVVQTWHGQDGAVPGYFESVSIYDSSGHLVADKQALVERLAKAIATCVEGIRF